MKNLLKKEFLLSFHPTAAIFVAMAAMILIPDYPYYVAFFYGGLAVFFTCINGRENNDVFFSAMLPIRKSEIVRARYLYVLFVELAQIVIAIPFTIIRTGYDMPNTVGMDANMAMFGIALIILGLFNLVFFAIYYKNVKKPGVAAIVASVVYFVVMSIAEVLVHIIPFLRDVIDTPDPLFWGYKLIFLGIGLVLYAVLTLISFFNSVKNFAKQDI
ncbi:MAG: ABC-2 transporter permease [Bacilli bacterium]|jgi:hypothetical protein